MTYEERSRNFSFPVLWCQVCAVGVIIGLTQHLAERADNLWEIGACILLPFTLSGGVAPIESCVMYICVHRQTGVVEHQSSSTYVCRTLQNINAIEQTYSLIK